MKLGGKVVYPENSRASPMGSGHMYYEGDKKAAKFDHIKFIDNNGNAFAPDRSWVSGYASAKCYGLSDFTYHDFGSSFYYGGPGGC
ncbi:hypothetical protein AXF42_Ash019212 [Apostasia shenzhenica]|uniref:Neprosin PEP catalytic domain-containing protein n=1 Tax=Apostasia shenzhenica TaxID=1088818 RepID=A0A2I0B2J9_9ASPA|nr:hypothetical protein AXF42_Ash019212 [Apostasia shenzhenica]